MKKLTYEYVKQYFKENNCELLEEEYKNNSIKMKYKCSCGNTSEISFANFKGGRRCEKCARKRRAKKQRHTFEYVKKYMEKYGCELLSKEYKNANYNIKYKCKCGDSGITTFARFKRGVRCRRCGVEKISGKNNYNYNQNLTDKDRERNKSRTSDYLYKQWRMVIYSRDDYICKKCNKRGGELNAHHILNYSTNESIRLNEENGITFCESCHKEFHRTYGVKNNSRKQLDEFLMVNKLCLK